MPQVKCSPLIKGTIYLNFLTVRKKFSRQGGDNKAEIKKEMYGLRD